jgi:fumarylacetoacetase
VTDETHEPSRRSWVESANDPATDFPIQNLPYCTFRPRGPTGIARVGIGIGDMILDVSGVARAGLLAENARAIALLCERPSLNALMAAGREDQRDLRRAVAQLLDANSAGGKEKRRDARGHLTAMSDCDLLLPADIRDYTDFYASVEHASTVGALFRPDNPLLPNYRYVPIGYHGRASSIVVSGTPIRRPAGQTRPDPNAAPVFGATRRLDYELELAAFVGAGNLLGDRILIDEAEESVFGVALLNDWSARDIQGWEYQPLGPFLGKNFATTVAPWVVTVDALAPFRVPARPRASDEPKPLPYLYDATDQAAGGLDIIVEAALSSARMRADGIAPFALSRANSRGLYWTLAQMVTHHTSNGCNLRPGDVIATGTISGDASDARGCLLERTRGGADPITLPSGETRTFLTDGDEVILRAHCEGGGFRRIGFGECRGTIVA